MDGFVVPNQIIVSEKHVSNFASWNTVFKGYVFSVRSCVQTIRVQREKMCSKDTCSVWEVVFKQHVLNVVNCVCSQGVVIVNVALTASSSSALRFTNQTYMASVVEHSPPGTVVLTVRAQVNGTSPAVYSLAVGDDIFNIDSHTGKWKYILFVEITYNQTKISQFVNKMLVSICQSRKIRNYKIIIMVPCCWTIYRTFWNSIWKWIVYFP